jgi:hypothetical protein
MACQDYPLSPGIRSGITQAAGDREITYRPQRPRHKR